MRSYTISPQPYRMEERQSKLSGLLDKTLDLLKNGSHYTREEVSKNLNITNQKANLLLSFLLKFNFLQNLEGNRLRINPTIKELWEKL